MAILFTVVWALPTATFVSAQTNQPWTLPQALEYVTVNNPDVRIAQQRILVAQAGLSQANAAFSPQLQFQSSYMRTDNPMQVFGAALNQRSFNLGMDFNHVPDADNMNAKGLVTMPLYAGGRNVATRNAAKAGEQAAKSDAEAVKNALSFEVTRAYLTILKIREHIQTAEAGVRAFETNLSIANKRFNAGALLKNEVLDVEVRLAQAREELVRAQNAHSLAERSLRNLLGIEQDDFTVANATPEILMPDINDYSGRAELASAQSRQRAAEAGVQRAKGGHLPRMNAFGSMDYDYGTKFDGDGKSYTAGVIFQWDLWDGRLTRAKVKEAKANMDQAREEERKVRLAIDLETQQARLAIKEANERLKVTDKIVSQAAESVELTRSRFEQGLALSTQLIDAETALIAARVRRSESESNLRIAIAGLRKALGIRQLE